MKLWTFKTKNFALVCFTEKDTFDPSYMDPELVKECREKLRSGEWKIFQTTVRVVHRPSNTVLAEEYLGGSIYADPKEFYREHIGISARARRDGKNYGCYFSDMVRTACAEARKELKSLREQSKTALDNYEMGVCK